MAAPWLGTAEAYEASFARLCAGTVADMINAFPAASGAWLLDVGTGPGTLAAAALRAGFVPVGVDADESMISLARRRHPRVVFVQAALPDLPCPDKAFDAVAANFVINHVPDPRAAVRELFRVTRPGGRLAATIWPAVIGPMNQLWLDIMEMAQVEPLRDVQLPPGRDFDRTADGFRNLLTEGGFDDVVTHEVQWLFEISPSDLWRAVSAGIAAIGQPIRPKTRPPNDGCGGRTANSHANATPKAGCAFNRSPSPQTAPAGLPTTKAIHVNARVKSPQDEERMSLMPILPAERDPRLITVRRGGTLTDEHHRMLAEWALLCAEHVLHHFDEEQPRDIRPRDAIDAGRGWVRGEVRMSDARRAAFAANAAARGLPDPAKFAALAAGQAAAVPHVAAHDLGAAAYAIRAVGASASAGETEAARVREREWQRERLPAEVRELVLDDQRSRSPICWNVFDD